MKQTIYIYNISPFPIFRYQDVTFDIVQGDALKKIKHKKINAPLLCRIKVFQWTACPCSLNVFILKFVFYCWNRTSCMGVFFLYGSQWRHINIETL